MAEDSISSREQRLVTDLFQLAGITVDGPNPWDIRIYDDRVYPELLQHGSLGLGESYMAGWWDCEQLDEFIARLMRADLEKRVKNSLHFQARMLFDRFINFQTRRRSLEVGRVHYDIDPQLYRRMLDSEMNYSCGYWRDASNLDEAQRAKLELSCRKLKLEPGMKVLDIGCGFGAFAKHAATHHQVNVVGVTISEQQANWARKNCEGLPVEIRFQDYRDVRETFDRIVSIGMFEHVGKKNYKEYMSTVCRNLVEGGLFLLHTIGTTSAKGIDPWIIKYIFPNSALPNAREIPRACSGRLTIEDWHSFGGDYIETLKAWYKNFMDHWHTLDVQRDERFFRMWTYYLQAFVGGFKSKRLEVWQVVLSKNRRGDYHPVR